MGRRYLYLLLFLYCSLRSFGQVAPDFQYTTLDGQVAQLSDYQNQVVYVSFWASWCKPCLVNFKKYKAMRDELAEMGVVLLNVNIDKSKEKWESALTRHTIDGVHVRGKELDALQELYSLYSIPVYEIISKKGELVYLSDEPDRNILEEFKAWVNE